MNNLSFKNIRSVLQNYWAAILAVSVAIFASYYAITYANLPILEMYGFRQTQTALSVYWMVHEGWQLAYQTPVAGYPWSIPFEFPLYQSLVALIVWLGDFQIDVVGRLVSFGFLLACAWPAFSLSRRVKLPPETAWVFCALLWSSPLYLFWGRSFMIETTAVFFTLAAMPYAIDLCDKHPRWRSTLLCAFFFLLAGLQKVTTAAPVIMIMAMVVLVTHIKTAGIVLPSLQQLICASVAFLLPLVVIILWTKYTDTVKSLNPLGLQLTSNVLNSWNFGTLDQRLDPEVLKTVFWDRVLSNNAAGFLGIALITSAIIFGKWQIKALIAICLILFALPVFIFTNLHYIHTYYQTSCTVFLLAALAISCTLWLPQVVKAYAITPAIITVLLVVANIYHFSKNDIQTIKNVDTPNLTTLLIGNAIKRYTPEDSGIVVYGYDWSSEVTYYAQRKSFTVPEWFKDYSLAWLNPTTYLGGKKLGALIFCKMPTSQVIQRSDVKQTPRLLKIDNCHIWFPDLPLNALDEITTRLPQNIEPKPISCGANQYIERINGANAPIYENSTSIGLLSVEGWLAVSAAEGITADTTFVTMTDTNGITKYLKTRSTPRHDVNKMYKHPSMPDVGFTTLVDVAGLQGNYVLGLARVYKGQLERCTEVNASVTIQ